MENRGSPRLITDKQFDYILDLGGIPRVDMTREEASEMIEGLLNEDDRPEPGGYRPDPASIDEISDTGGCSGCLFKIFVLILIVMVLMALLGFFLTWSVRS